MTSIFQAFSATSPTSVNFDSLPGGQAVDKKLAHGDLAGLCELTYLFGMAYYGGDFSGINRLYLLFEEFSDKKAQYKRWKVNNPETLKKASKVAIDMHLYPQYYIFCRTCGGSGSQQGVHRGKDCRTCEGTGRKPQTGAEISRQLGINKSNFNRTWTDRLDFLWGEVQFFHSKIAIHLNNRNDNDNLGINMGNSP